MSETKDTPLEFQPWPLHDMAFASSQLLKEYPRLVRAQIAAALNSAAPIVRPGEGRVQLMRRAREFLRGAL